MTCSTVNHVFIQSPTSTNTFIPAATVATASIRYDTWFSYPPIKHTYIFDIERNTTQHNTTLRCTFSFYFRSCLHACYKSLSTGSPSVVLRSYTYIEHGGDRYGIIRTYWYGMTIGTTIILSVCFPTRAACALKLYTQQTVANHVFKNALETASARSIYAHARQRSEDMFSLADDWEAYRTAYIATQRPSLLTFHRTRGRRFSINSSTSIQYRGSMLARKIVNVFVFLTET